MTSPESRLKERGVELPPVAKPIASYVPALRQGNLVFTSGQLPIAGGQVQVAGRLGAEVSVEEGRRAARLACLNALAAARSAAGSLDAVERVVSLAVFVQSAEDFHDQAKVANGASELLEEIFGEAGRHTRMALGANALPLNAAVELTLTLALRPETPTE